MVPNGGLSLTMLKGIEPFPGCQPPLCTMDSVVTGPTRPAKRSIMYDKNTGQYWNLAGHHLDRAPRLNERCQFVFQFTPFNTFAPMPKGFSAVRRNR